MTEFPTSRKDILAEREREGYWEGDIGHAHKDGSRIVVSSRWALQGEGSSREVLEVNRDVTMQRCLDAERAIYLAQQTRIAEFLQHSLLMVPPPDLYPGLTVKAFYNGAQEDVLVGGDFFDIYAVSENRVALLVGDATGKGLEAAVYTAEVKFALRALLREYPTPALALTHLNAFVSDRGRLAPHLDDLSYIVLALVTVDTATGAVEAATFQSGGLSLGVSVDAVYVGQEAVLAEGDVLVMTTDGITGARHPAKRLDFFGPDGLQRAVREEMARLGSLSEALRAVVGRAHAFAGGDGSMTMSAC